MKRTSGALLTWCDPKAAVQKRAVFPSKSWQICAVVWLALVTWGVWQHGWRHDFGGLLFGLWMFGITYWLQVPAHYALHDWGLSFRNALHNERYFWDDIEYYQLQPSHLFVKARRGRKWNFRLFEFEPDAAYVPQLLQLLEQRLPGKRM